MHYRTQAFGFRGDLKKKIPSQVYCNIINLHRERKIYLKTSTNAVLGTRILFTVIPQGLPLSPLFFNIYCIDYIKC